MRVPLYDPRAEYHALREPIDEAIRSVLESGVYTAGPRVTQLEAGLADYLGVRFALGVGSGSAAIQLALAACGVGPGDEVITAANTDMSTATSVTHCGARVVFADVEPETFVLSPAAVEAKLTKRTRAIVPVHLFGQLCDMDALREIAGSRSLAMIEDAALAIGGEYRGEMAGTMGDAGCLSMNSRKILNAFGDAGAVVTSREDVASAIRSLRDYGKAPSRKGWHLGRIELVREGFNSRLDEIQAAVLSVKLSSLEDALGRRRTIAARYDEGLAGSSVRSPVVRAHTRHAYRAYTVLVDSLESRDSLARHLEAREIQTAAYYVPPLHLQPAYEYLGHERGDFPEAERVAETMLSLPIHPTLSEEQVDYVVESVTSFTP